MTQRHQFHPAVERRGLCVLHQPAQKPQPSIKINYTDIKRASVDKGFCFCARIDE
jgi:hypothetical protein